MKQAIIIDMDEQDPKVIEIKKFLTELIYEYKVFSLDTETTGLHYDDKFLGLSLAFEDSSGVIKSIWVPESLFQDNFVKNTCQEILEARDKTMIGHNLSFDIPVLEKYGFMVHNKLADTKVLWHLMYPNDQSGLKYLANSKLGIKSEEFKDLLARHSVKQLNEITNGDAEAYAAKDAALTLMLYNHIKRQSNITLHNKYFSTVEVRYIPVIAQMRKNGILIDKVRLDHLLSSINNDLTAAKAELAEITSPEFNPNSSKQVGEMLYNQLKYGVKRRSAGGKPSTAKQALEEMIGHLPELITKLRRLQTLKTTFLEPMRNNICQDGRLRTLYNLANVVHGRLSSSHINLQNIPNSDKDIYQIRNLFVASPGNDLITLDFKMFEYMVMAHFSQDKKMLEAFNSGQDLHTLTSLKCFGTADKSFRTKAKNINFGLCYGMGVFKLQTYAKISLAEARKFKDVFEETYSEFIKWRESTFAEVKRLGYTETLLGRRIPVSGFEWLNYKVSGTASEIMKVGQTKVMENVPTFRQCMQIHDEVVGELPEQSGEVGKIVGLLEEFKLDGVRLKIEFNVSKTWSKG